MMRLRLGAVRRLIVVCLGILAWVPLPGVYAQEPTPELLAAEVIESTLPLHDGGWFRDPEEGEEFPPLRVLLSRYRYWSQDRHLDVVVQMADEAPRGELRVRINDSQGNELSRFELSPLPGQRFVMYPAIPEAMAVGGAAEIKLAWVDGGETLAEHTESFRVEVFDEPAERAGRVRLSVLNEPGVIQRGAPVTVGVPFPRGTLADTAHLRLVDDAGQEHPLQIKETARWSRFGSIRWVLCDFTTDLDGSAREFFLEYGPDVQRVERDALEVSETEGFPVVEAGRLRFDEGLWFDAEGDGNYVKVLDEQGLSGAFVEHENGQTYRTPLADRYEVECSGPEKVVLRRAGWYREDGGEEFCKYVIRYVIHRDSPLVRIFHTWIFTGDGNRERITNMGWQFALPEGFERRGFLTAFGEEGTWEDGDFLLQYDYEHFDISAEEAQVNFPGRRAAGVAAAEGDGARLYFGAKDFWQNYPSELEFSDGALWFHNWPRHNRPAGHTFDKELIMEPGAPAASASAARYEDEAPESLTRSEWLLNILQLRYAHEGESLDFRLPEIMGEEAIHSQIRPAWELGDVDGVNAQGLSRTEEMWLFFENPDADQDNAVATLEGLNAETLRGVADPAWVARSGAFYEIHHQDWENYPEEERIYELVALAVPQWIEQLGMYGMWLHGDLFAWGGLALESRQPSLYRALRKAHHGWPYSWTPYARSSDPRLLKIVEAATRQLIDASYCHYAGGALRERMEGTNLPRRVGLWNVGPVPWAGGPVTQTYSMHNKAEYMLHAWYLTGYHRALDNLRSSMQEARLLEDLARRGAFRTLPRTTSTMIKSWLEIYEATFDPWFLVAARALGEGHMHYYREGRLHGHNYNTGDREYMRYTGCPDFKEYYLHYADRFHEPHELGGGWIPIGLPIGESQAFSWMLTGEERYLRRTTHWVDWVTQAVYDSAEPEHVQGQYTYGHGTVIFTGFGLRLFPHALAALEKASRRPDPIGTAFALRLSERNQEIVLRKEAGEALEMKLFAQVTGNRFLGLHQLDEDATAPYEVIGPGGVAAVVGEWRVHDRESIKIPADAPAGDYRLRVPRGLDVPVSPVDHPEVIVLAPEAGMPHSHREGRHWFMVPEDVEEFYVDVGFPHAQGRITVWGPDGERVWNVNYHAGSHKDGNSVRADIPVEPEQAGRLWRITVPGHGGGSIKFDPQIPPVFSTDPTRWFMPKHLYKGS